MAASVLACVGRMFHFLGPKTRQGGGCQWTGPLTMVMILPSGSGRIALSPVQKERSYEPDYKSRIEGIEPDIISPDRRAAGDFVEQRK